MKYCGFGCQNSCGYPRMRIRSSDTPLVQRMFEVRANEWDELEKVGAMVPLLKKAQSGFMGTIAGDYNRQHSVNRRKSPAIYRSVSLGYVHLAEHDGWHCRR